MKREWLIQKIKFWKRSRGDNSITSSRMNQCSSRLKDLNDEFRVTRHNLKMWFNARWEKLNRGKILWLLKTQRRRNFDSQSRVRIKTFWSLIRRWIAKDAWRIVKIVDGISKREYENQINNGAIYGERRFNAKWKSRGTVVN